MCMLVFPVQPEGSGSSDVPAPLIWADHEARYQQEEGGRTDFRARHRLQPARSEAPQCTSRSWAGGMRSLHPKWPLLPLPPRITGQMSVPAHLARGGGGKIAVYDFPRPLPRFDSQRHTQPAHAPTHLARTL